MNTNNAKIISPIKIINQNTIQKVKNNNSQLSESDTNNVLLHLGGKPENVNNTLFSRQINFNLFQKKLDEYISLNTRLKSSDDRQRFTIPHYNYPKSNNRLNPYTNKYEYTNKTTPVYLLTPEFKIIN